MSSLKRNVDGGPTAERRADRGAVRHPRHAGAWASRARRRGSRRDSRRSYRIPRSRRAGCCCECARRRRRRRPRRPRPTARRRLGRAAVRAETDEKHGGDQEAGPSGHVRRTLTSAEEKALQADRSRPYAFHMAAQAGSARTDGEPAGPVDGGQSAVELRVQVAAQGVRVAAGARGSRHRSFQRAPANGCRHHRHRPGRRRGHRDRAGRHRRHQPGSGVDRLGLGDRPAGVRHARGRPGVRRVARRGRPARRSRRMRWAWSPTRGCSSRWAGW